MDFKESYVGDGKVYLLAGGGKVFTDIAARFVHGERSVEEICDSPYSAKIVKNILSSGHLAATEFDWFAIGVKAVCLVLGALGIAGMWAAIFADVGVMVIAVLNAIRAMRTPRL